MFYARDNSSIYEANSEVKVGQDGNNENMILCGVLDEEKKKNDVYDITCIRDIEGQYVTVFKPENGYTMDIREFEVYGYYIDSLNNP